MSDYLSACDFGWMVRENTITNQVASPVKFAEYLAAGLEVIIGEQLGDYSEYVVTNKAGFIWDSEKVPATISKPDQQQKKRLMELAKREFVKENYRDQYFNLLK